MIIIKKLIIENQNLKETNYDLIIITSYPIVRNINWIDNEIPAQKYKIVEEDCFL